MAVQYTVPIKSYDNVSWRANVYSNSWTGGITTIKGSLGQSMMLSYEGEMDNHFGVLIKSTLTLNVLNEGNININELQNAADKEYRIEIQRNNVLYWVGYIIAEDIEQPLRSDVPVFTLTAICGLSMLSEMDYVHQDNLPGGRVPMNFIRMILFGDRNLNVPIPIRWTNQLRNIVFEGQDVFIGDVEWSPRGEGFSQTDVDSGVALPKKAQYILEGMLKSMQCRIYQANGRWNIRRIPDYYGGSFTYRQIPGNFNQMLPAPATESIIKNIGDGGYNFINERDLITTIPGIKSSKITYNSDVKENILPNGNLDLLSIGSILYWGFYGDDTSAFYTTDISLDGRGGYSAKLQNGGSTTAYFTMLSEGSLLRTGGLPIDAKDLVKLINFSFIFSPSQYGFPYDTSNGIATAIITAPGSGYADGVYTNVPTVEVTGTGDGGSVNVTISGGAVTEMQINAVGSGYNVNNFFTIPDSTGGGDGDGFRARITGITGGIINFDTNPLQLQIVMNTGSTQYFLDDFGIWRDASDTYISPKVESLKVGDVARVALDKFRGVILPEPEFKPEAGDICDIKVIFLVKPGQVYTVDNISISIEDSDDVYVCTADNSKNTKEESDELGISSSFAGYMVSNFMTNWDKSDSECFFQDGDKYTGTLTGLTADVIMRCKYTSSKIYNGSINVRGQNWSFDEIYTIETLADRRFMPINANYNIEKCEVELIAIETRNDDISRTEKAYGSNSKQLSN